MAWVWAWTQARVFRQAWALGVLVAEVWPVRAPVPKVRRPAPLRWAQGYRAGPEFPAWPALRAPKRLRRPWCRGARWPAQRRACLFGRLRGPARRTTWAR